MTELGEAALVQLLLAYAPLAELVSDRVLWDDAEQDLAYPSVTLRLLSTSMPTAHLRSRGGSRQSLVEASAHAETSTMAARINDRIVQATDLYQTPFEITVDGSIVRFGEVRVTDVQQASASRARAYRKSVFLTVWQYEEWFHG